MPDGPSFHETPPTTEHARAIGPVTAAVCSCGAAVLHESPSVVAGFVADHEPGRRPGCVRVVTGHDLDEVCRRFASPEALGVLFL